MGNCLSKLAHRVQFVGTKNRQGWVKTGASVWVNMNSLGCHLAERNDILTPAGDRFPPQACDLIMAMYCKLSGPPILKIVAPAGRKL